MVHDTTDESAIGLATAGFIVVVMAAILGVICGNIAPVGPGPAEHHLDVNTADVRTAPAQQR